MEDLVSVKQKGMLFMGQLEIKNGAPEMKRAVVTKLNGSVER